MHKDINGSDEGIKVQMLRELPTHKWFRGKPEDTNTSEDCTEIQ
jgi:hypothetical protein